jgi:hypothetical protein
LCRRAGGVSGIVDRKTGGKCCGADVRDECVKEDALIFTSGVSGTVDCSILDELFQVRELMKCEHAVCRLMRLQTLLFILLFKK